MKNLMLLATIVVVLTVFNGCNKEKEVTETASTDFVSSKYLSEYGKYKKELLIFDDSKENSIMIVCHSENEEALNRYLKNTDLELILDNTNQDLQTKSAKVTSDSINSLKEPKDLDENIVHVDIITYNLKSLTNKFYLSVKPKVVQQSIEQTCLLKNASISTPYIPNWYYAVGYTSLHNSKFFGVSHYGNGWGEDMYDYGLKFYKTNCGLCSWDTVWSGMIYESTPYWAVMDYRSIPDNNYSYTRLKIVVIPDYYDPNPYSNNYLIAYTPQEFYSHDCAMGSYDARNCYLGTPPAGTTAFFYGGQLYYTPVNGNECPLPGSSFDGANCAVGFYPEGSSTFVWANNWYIKPLLINL